MVARQFTPLAALLLLGVACAPRKTGAEYHVRLLVTNIPGDALARVPVSLAGKQVGLTNSTGYADLTIVGQEGMRANLGIQCPPNHRQPTEPVAVGLFDYEGENIPEVSTICEQERVRQGVIVRTAGVSDLPFSLRGQPAGTTNRRGVGHVLVEGEPGETVDLLFDTSEYPDLQPANPSVRLVLSNHDDAALADQRFEVKKTKAKKSNHGVSKKKSPELTPETAHHDGPVRIR